MAPEGKTVKAGVIDMFPILSGKCDSIDISFVLNPEPVPELSIKFPEPFTVSGSISDLSGYMSISVRSDIPYETVCARCLKPIHRTESIVLQKTVAVKGTLENEEAAEIDEGYLLIEDGLLDVGSPLCEQLIMELPVKTLCREDCAGLCQRCGKDLNEGRCSCPDHLPDPRLACLAKLLEDSGQ